MTGTENDIVRRDSPGLRGTRAIVTKYGITFGFEPGRPYPPEEMGACPVGWLGMFERTVQRLIKLGWDRQLDQVKYKFGRVRMYPRSSTRPMDTIVQRFMARSAKVCATCGARAERDSPGSCGPHWRESETGEPVVVRRRRRSGANRWLGRT